MQDDLPKPSDGTPSPQQPYQPPNYPASPQTPPLTSSNPPNLPDPSNYPQNPDPIIEAHRETAQHQPRNDHGQFVPEHPDQNNSHLPPLVETNPKPDTKGEYPPLFQIANPVTYLRIFWNKVMKNEGIKIGFNFTVKPVTAVMIALVLTGTYSLGYGNGVNSALSKLFPTSSPIFHRGISLQGIIQKSQKGEYFLKEDIKDNTLWTLRSASANVNLSEFEGMKVQIKGNLTPTPYLIEVSEVISFDTKPTPTPTSQTFPNTPNLPNIPNQDLLPKLYSGLTWEVTQRKVLLFTSGKRRIEQQGVYLESAQVNAFPQDFINYYTQELKNKGFKETLNSTDPDGTTITYSKEDLFLTFGVKNVFSGSGENKKITGYKAYIEHN